jgi:hypothetical protein
LCASGIIELKYPRNTFGLDDDGDSTDKHTNADEAIDSDEGVKINTHTKEENDEET